MTGQEWWRRWQRSRPVSSALVDHNGSSAGEEANHDTDLLRELHEQHADALWSYALRLTGDRSRAQNVVQETLLRAWRDPRMLDPESGLQRSWLCTVARNIVIDESSTAYWSPEIDIDRVLHQPNGDASESVVYHQLVVAALGRLTQEHRQVLRECYFRGNSVAEAAQALGIEPSTVKSRAYYALRALRLAIEELAGVE